MQEDTCLHIGNSQPVSAGYTHFITSPVSKDATGTLPLRNLQVITDSYGQTVVTPQNKPTGAENKKNGSKMNLRQRIPSPDLTAGKSI